MNVNWKNFSPKIPFCGELWTKFEPGLLRIWIVSMFLLLRKDCQRQPDIWITRATCVYFNLADLRDLVKREFFGSVRILFGGQKEKPLPG